MLYSHSRLKTFEQCKLKYKFKYIDKVETKEAQSVEAFLGKSVHAALEKLYKDLKFQKADSLEELLQWFRDEWSRNWNNEILIVREEYTQENYMKMGEKFIADYYNRYKPFAQAKTIGLEQKVMITLDGQGKYSLQGYIDRLSSPADGVYEIHDYKTNAYLPPEEQMREDRQLALYALAVLSRYQDASQVKLIWHFLASDKMVVIEKTEEELDRLKGDVIELIKKVESEKEFKPTRSKLCDWCEFRPICPEWKHLAKTENLPPNEYLQEPGVKLVNLYAELKAKEEEVQAEIGKVKEAILALAEKDGVTALAGSDHVARIWSKEVWKLPNHESPLRPDLEAFVKGIGKWEEASRLDTYALEKVIEFNSWPKDLVAKLKNFAELQRLERIYLNKKKQGL